jgi:hypothetical protein
MIRAGKKTYQGVMVFHFFKQDGEEPYGIKFTGNNLVVHEFLERLHESDEAFALCGGKNIAEFFAVFFGGQAFEHLLGFCNQPVFFESFLDLLYYASLLHFLILAPLLRTHHFFRLLPSS